MTQIVKPMLASAMDPKLVISESNPMMASPKLDGVRAMVQNGIVYSRSLKPIPNWQVQDLFGREVYNGLDGELIIGSPCAQDTFKRTMSGVMTTTAKTPDIKFHVFDNWAMKEPYKDRYAYVRALLEARSDYAVAVYQEKVNSDKWLDAHHAHNLYLGYEGTMVRSPDALYKHGRATAASHDLMKLKEIVDAEAIIIGTDEMMHNLNEFDNNIIKKRSSTKAGLKGAGMLGAIKVRGLNGQFKDVEFSIGSGFTQAERLALWDRALDGLIVKYKYTPAGVDKRPRHPIFLGFRDRRDI
jgi:DNA ligase 1